MGVTIRNKEDSIDIGYGGFYNLRKNIAHLLSQEFGKLYEEWCNPLNGITNEEGNRRLKELFNNGTLTDDDNCILDFLFAPDCDGKIPAKACKRLYALIKDYDDDVIYGYWGRTDCVRFKDFKEIVEQSAKHRWIISWS